MTSKGAESAIGEGSVIEGREKLLQAVILSLRREYPSCGIGHICIDR